MLAVAVPRRAAPLAPRRAPRAPRAVRPAHSPLDGDTLFAVSVPAGVGALEVGVDKLAALTAAAADAVQAAIVDAVAHATGAYEIPAWCDIVTTDG